MFDNLENESPTGGKLLISEPFLYDPNFRRAVVLLCEHNAEGTIGFVLNHRLDITLLDVLEADTALAVPLYLGGPVQKNTLHIIHYIDALKSSSERIADNIYWGGDFEKVKEMLANNTLDTDKIRFFIGYSGWGGRQLADEIEEKSWIVTGASEDIVFQEDNDKMWKSILKKMGGKYKFLANSPESPFLN